MAVQESAPRSGSPFQASPAAGRGVPEAPAGAEEESALLSAALQGAVAREVLLGVAPGSAGSPRRPKPTPAALNSPFPAPSPSP
eukprot:220797-Pyramimonas_sp.AAC.1